ncbi:MAG: STAS domain-containing protein [Bifidobacteriaceae bacterium]|jgi:anti-anti-sigma factor|nr:STAS domain-containing protein [Bifidobacteriaceae bacterium]
MLNTNESVTGNTYTIELEGRLDSVTSSDFKARIAELQEAKNDIVLDLKKLDFLSSAGLQILVMAYKKAHEQKETIKFSIVNPQDSVVAVIKLTSLERILEN